jgi:hypothetical protein
MIDPISGHICGSDRTGRETAFCIRPYTDSQGFGDGRPDDYPCSSVHRNRHSVSLAVDGLAQQFRHRPERGRGRDLQRIRTADNRNITVPHIDFLCQI